MNLSKRIFSCIIILLLLAILCLYGTLREQQNHMTGSVNVQSLVTGRGTMNEQKVIALTFDDGPDEYYTDILLDGLQKRSVKATFFVMGKKAKEHPELIQRMHQEGHLIGNHTYSHMQYKKGKEEQFIQELKKTSEIIFEITGEETTYVRPPFGSFDKILEKELNMFPVLWTIDPLDWCSDNAECVAKKVISKAKNQDIILMHDQYNSSITAAFTIIDELQKQGFTFVTIEEILFD